MKTKKSMQRKENEMKVLILTNYQMGLYKFRRELLEALVADYHKVYVSVPEGEFTKELKRIGVRLIDNKYLDRRGTNPIQDLRLMNYYKGMMRKVEPDVVLTYTIKPNVYGGIVCGRLHIPCIANVTGLGTSIENGGLMQKITLALYKRGLKNARKIFFQNRSNRDFMLSRGVVDEHKIDILPGSGVNTEEHCYEPYPEEWIADMPSTGRRRIIFTTIGRIMKDKGIEEFLTAAKIVKSRHPEMDIKFRLIGDFDENYEFIVKEYEKKGIIEYLGTKRNVHSYIAESHAIIHPSYHEGMSNVLQEAASTGRPVIATDIPGCIETFEPGVTGIACKPRDTDSLVFAVEQFLALSCDRHETMGNKAREKMKREFSREIVIKKYEGEILSDTWDDMKLLVQ